MKKLILVFLTAIYATLMMAQHISSLVPKNSEEALLSSQKAYDNRQFNLASHYADIVLRDSSTAKHAAEIKIQCMGQLMKTKNDSSKYIIALLELHTMEKNNPLFIKLLMNYFTSPGHEHEMRQFANDEIRMDSCNKLAWALRGETFMREHNWNEAIYNFKKTVSIDSTFVEGAYNTGICYMSKALEYKDSLTKDNKKLQKEEYDSIATIFQKSQEWLERAKELDPERKTVDWKSPLYQVYLVVDEQKAKELKDK